LLLHATTNGLNEFARKHVAHDQKIVIKFAEEFLIVTQNKVVLAVRYYIEVLFLPETLERINLGTQFALLECALSDFCHFLSEVTHFQSLEVA
jgi:hypothetical protein